MSEVIQEVDYPLGYEKKNLSKKFKWQKKWVGGEFCRYCYTGREMQNKNIKVGLYKDCMYKEERQECRDKMVKTYKPVWK